MNEILHRPLALMDVRDELPVLAKINVHYSLHIPAGTRETVDRALALHQDKCPTAVSSRGPIEASWSAGIEEA